MQVLYQRCAAVDVGKDVIAVAVRLPGDGPDGRATVKRTFKTFYGVLAEAARWLTSLGVTHVAMEATGKWGGYRSQIAKKKAIVVVAHALVVIIWHILATGKPYYELGADYFTTRLERETRRLIAKLEALGHTVTLDPAA